MLLFKKKTFKEMAACDEGIATNLLSGRLKLLESLDLITKRKLPSNKKENLYLLTEKGMDLTPIILELALWSDKHARVFNPDMNLNEGYSADKAETIEHVKREYREFVSQTLAWA